MVLYINITRKRNSSDSEVSKHFGQRISSMTYQIFRHDVLRAQLSMLHISLEFHILSIMPYHAMMSLCNNKMTKQDQGMKGVLYQNILAISRVNRGFC